LHFVSGLQGRNTLYFLLLSKLLLIPSFFGLKNILLLIRAFLVSSADSWSVDFVKNYAPDVFVAVFPSASSKDGNQLVL
jgi:hypothetical protein